MELRKNMMTSKPEEMYNGTPYETFVFTVPSDRDTRTDFLGNFIHLGKDVVLGWRGEQISGPASGRLKYEFDINATIYNRKIPQTHVAEFLIAAQDVLTNADISYFPI